MAQVEAALQPLSKSKGTEIVTNCFKQTQNSSINSCQTLLSPEYRKKKKEKKETTAYNTNIFYMWRRGVVHFLQLKNIAVMSDCHLIDRLS